ncbi:TIGR00375 family protein [Alicyclobacillus cycloheptanicus]|uniref:Uncharacterized protein (TIGR00375 family) n=1 Tax=Alicyclobacillus cycloheptanicus TaxID=1457 RepID=A0ABT9XDP6_9BACL|nr:endonuclease Q family protein [Alicyclobacillus cycloheptanicus]MDQ0188425.1 uncharacterized protein (TIGR00375 family) [Alicyclobacillus cycloheptanicus]WDM01127.1 TIGR00375 family protein [Alicyclobacillus cycloheptanicus]
MNPLQTFYCDFHIHVGRALGKPVKMAAAPSLTFEALCAHARTEKGLDIVTVIDGVCTGVLAEVRDLAARGTLAPLADGGGLRHENGLTIFLGAEVECAGPHGGAAHFGCWFGDIDAAADFSAWLATVQKNPSLSSQRARTDAFDLQRQTHQRHGLFIVHHAFTPHKGLYGACVRRLGDMVDPAHVDALELGLSADTDMADCVSELAAQTFLSNSDAHSLPKIAREYNALMLEAPTFAEVGLALWRTGGRRVAANYGLPPSLGKYHRTYCLDCGRLWAAGAAACACGSQRKVNGVYDRFLEIRDHAFPVSPSHRPPYVHQIPLEFIPGLGPAARQRLLAAFGTEMNVLHRADAAALAEVVGPTLAARIDDARAGRVLLQTGGGGIYGKVQFK